MAENGRKWSKKVHRGNLVGNGFSRVIRHSPTTQFQVLSCDKQRTFYSSILPYTRIAEIKSARPCLCRIHSSDLFSFLSSFHSCCTIIHYNKYAILASDRHRNLFLSFPWYRWTVHYIYPWPRIQGNISIAYPLSIY